MLDSGQPRSLSSFIQEVEATEWTVQICNPTRPERIRDLVEGLFQDLEIDTTDVDVAGADDDIIVLSRDGRAVTASPLESLMDTLLMVNSDLYKTGTKKLQEIDPPDVITELSDTVFSLRGYPKSNSEKLVLTLVSRFIEHRAWSRESGTLQTSFQRLSRLDDENGTREVYERLGQLSALDVDVYGIPDWEPPPSMGVTPHGVTDDEIVRHWFVVYQSDTSSVAMLAVKTGPCEWEGYWTFDPDEARDIGRYVTQNFDAE